MNSIIRIVTISNSVYIANPNKSAGQIISLIDSLEDLNSDIILFPFGALTGSQCGDLYKNQSLINQCEDAIAEILHATKKLNSYIIFGSTLLKNAKPEDATYVLHKGEVIAILPKENSDFVFSIDDYKINIYSDSIDKLILNSAFLATIGADITLIPSKTTHTASSIDNDLNILKTSSLATGCAIAVANCGIGDTSFPRIAKGYSGIFEVGNQCIFECSLDNESVCAYDVDVDIIRASKATQNLPLHSGEVVFEKSINNKTFIIRELSKTPYLPSDLQKQTEYLEDLFDLQVASLSRRMKNIGIEKVVIGVSGGLDSTLALLVCAKAMDILELPRKNITAITMQGLGTSDKTYKNAIKLMDGLDCTKRDIPISDAVLSHLKAIGHTGLGVTFENAQARERTQILFDMANMIGGIVVGTGDLSESALGFCTFGGDHLASYNINVCLTKTVIRTLVKHLANNIFAKIGNTLISILDTPISPELLPVDNNGDISQKTEEILGEYELHDFFLYYFIKYNFTPEKILAYAICAFPEKYDRKYIEDKLRIFLKRILTSQFKRSCAVDSAIITDISLNEYNIPSDLSNSELFGSQIFF